MKDLEKHGGDISHRKVFCAGDLSLILAPIPRQPIATSASMIAEAELGIA